MTDTANLETGVDRFKQTFRRIHDELGRMIVGQDDIVEGVLVALFAGGHVLLEGVLPLPLVSEG